MTDWKTVHDSRAEKPPVIDLTTSETTVYERQNIRQETAPGPMEGDTVTEMVYEQREYTRAEYDMLVSPAIQGVQCALSEIELAIAGL